MTAVALDVLDDDPDGFFVSIEAGRIAWAHYVLAQAEAETAGIEFGPWAHTGLPVITYAAGPGAEAFNGTIDNTEVIGLVADAIGVTLEAPSMP